MIHFRVLGSLSLQGPDEREIEPVIRRPKYLALLTYLAAARPRGFHRRDALVSLLWPELDQLHARSALRSAVHYLRRWLGADVIVARGEEELSVNGTMLWSDFEEFERALEGGAATHTALELYRGDFLSGFHVSDAPDFERWLDEVRDRLRRQAVEAASQLADTEKRKGNLIGSLEWMRRAVEVSNHEEEKVRHFIALLASAGDRPGALRVYRNFQRRLAAELDLEPSPATQALAKEIRALLPQRHGITASDESHEPRIPNGPPQEIRASLNRDLDTSVLGRRPLVSRLLIAGLVLTVTVAGALITWRARSQSYLRLLGGDLGVAATGNAMRVVVFPFTIRGGTELGYLREGLAEVVSEAIDGLGELNRVHPLAVMSRMHPESSETSLDQQQARRIASHLGARRYIVGSVVGRGTRLAISASLYDIGAAEPLSEVSMEDEPNQLGPLANRLTRALMAEVPVGGGPRLRRLATIGTNDFVALKAYLQGEVLLRQGLYDSAVTKLRNSVEADSTFALGWYRLGLAYSLAQSMGHEGDNHASLEKATRYRDKLSTHDNLLLSGWRAHFHGQPEAAERDARQIIGGDPEDAEAWHLLGLTRMWYAWQRGQRYAEARTALERALAIDPRFPDAIYHAYWAAILEARYAYADSVFGVAPTGLVTGPWAQATRGFFAFVRGDRHAQEGYARSLEAVDDQSLVGSAWILASHSDSLKAARRWLSRFAGSTEHSDWGRTSGQIFLAHVEAAGGRWNEAQALFRHAAQSDPATALSSYAWLAAMPFFERPEPELSAIRDSVREWQVPPAPRDFGRLHPQTLPEVLTIPDELRPWARDYLLGLLSVRLGDRAEAERCAAKLDAAAEPRDRIGLRHDLALEIRASMALADGKPQAALDLLEGASMTVAHSNQVWYSPHYSRPLGRFVRAEALRQLGQDEEALGWYGTLGEKYGTEFVYRAPAFLRQAEIYERRGEPLQSLDYYRRFSMRWQDADPEYQPLVRQVGVRVRKLTVRSP